MNRKICYLILLLVHVLGAFFKYGCFFQESLETERIPLLSGCQSFRFFYGLLWPLQILSVCLTIDVLLGVCFWKKRPKDTWENSF